MRQRFGNIRRFQARIWQCEPAIIVEQNVPNSDFHKKYTTRARIIAGNKDNALSTPGGNISPLLFSIYINDMENYFRRKGARDINNDGKNDISTQVYADDIAIICHTHNGLCTKLKILEQYRKDNLLTVCCDQTKILAFYRTKQENKNGIQIWK